MKTDEILSALNSIPGIAWIAAIVTIVVGVAVFTNALQDILKFIKRLGRELSSKAKLDPKDEKEFNALRRSILHTVSRNDLPLVLHNLRQFLIAKGLVDQKQFKSFHDRWLTSYPVTAGIEALNVFTTEDIEQMTVDLQALRL